MSYYNIKNQDTIKLESPEFDIDVTTLKLVNAPVTNNSNTKVVSRNAVTGNVELSDKSSLVGDITMSNPSVNVNKRDILINPGTNVPLPGNFNFRSLVAGSGVTLTLGANDITIAATVPGTSSITVSNLGAGTGLIAATTGTIALPGNLNIKSLVAGTGVTITNGANSITLDATGVNIYNSNGTIPNVVRLVTLSNGTSLIFRGAVANSAAVTFDVLNTFTVEAATLLNLNTSAFGGTINLGNLLGGADIINIGNKTNIGSFINMEAENHIELDCDTIQLPSITSNLTPNFVTYDALGGGNLYYYPINNYYGSLRFSAAATQVFTSSSITQCTGISGTPSGTSSGVVLAGTNDGLQFNGVPKSFEISFSCTAVPNVGSQDLSVGLFINGIIQPSTAATNFAGTGSVILTTPPSIILLNTGDIIRVGFARATTNTFITFSGTLFIKSLTT